MSVSVRERLVVKDEKGQGESRERMCIEIYKIYVEMADRISARRHAANCFFLTINTALVGFAGYVGSGSGDSHWGVSLSGLLLCFVWFRLLLSYQDLNAGKFQVIHEIERELPLAPYAAEWEALGAGKDARRYLPFTRIESGVPMVFAALHGLVLIRSVF